MEKKRNIVQYRERLDKTLASPDLINEETLKTLVKRQLCSSEIEGFYIIAFEIIQVAVVIHELNATIISVH